MNPPDPAIRKARRRWAILIQRVYETDPLLCRKCGGRMKIISFIEARQADVLRKILEHCGLWGNPPPRAPPAPTPSAGTPGAGCGEGPPPPDPDVQLTFKADGDFEKFRRHEQAVEF